MSINMLEKNLSYEEKPPTYFWKIVISWFFNIINFFSAWFAPLNPTNISNAARPLLDKRSPQSFDTPMFELLRATPKREQPAQQAKLYYDTYHTSRKLPIECDTKQFLKQYALAKTFMVHFVAQHKLADQRLYSIQRMLILFCFPNYKKKNSSGLNLMEAFMNQWQCNNNFSLDQYYLDQKMTQFEVWM